MTLEAIRAIRRCSHGLARPPKCATKVDPIVALSSGSWKSGLIAAIEWREQAEGLIDGRKRLRCNPRYTFWHSRIGKIRLFVLLELGRAFLEGFCHSGHMLVDVVDDAALLSEFSA